MIRTSAFLILLWTSTAFAGWSPLGPYGGVITSISVTKDGIYAGTEGGGVFFSRDGGRIWEGRNRGLENWFVESLIAAKDGTVYAGTRDGVFKSGDGRVWGPLASIPRGSAVKNMAFDSAGNLLASVWGSGVYICKKDSDCTNPKKELSSPFVNSILPMENGDVVASTEGGVFLKPKGSDEWRVHGLTDYMIIPSIALDSEGVLYAGTWGGGVLYFKSKKVHVFEAEDWHIRSMGLGSSMVAVIARGNDGNLYAGTEGGISMLPKGRDTWSPLGLDYTYIKSIGFGEQGEIYAGSLGRGLFVMEKGKGWEERNRGIHNSNILSMAVSDKGELFAGTKVGLYISPKGDDNWVEVKELYGMKVNSFLFEGEKVYAGTSNGLFTGSASGKGWKRVVGDIGYMPVTSIARSDDFVYAGTDVEGVFRSPEKKGEWTQANGGLENLRVRTLVKDKEGSLLAGTYGGVYKLQKGRTEWEKAGLQESCIVSIAVHEGKVYAAAENTGVFSMKDGKWVPLEGALPNRRILSLFHSDKGLYATGYGWIAYREGEGPWRDITGELSNTVIQTVVADKGGNVYAGTWGSGIFLLLLNPRE